MSISDEHGLMWLVSLQDNIVYELIGSESAQQAFYVNPDTGLVSLKKSLSETVDDTFTVSFTHLFYVNIYTYIQITHFT